MYIVGITGHRNLHTGCIQHYQAQLYMLLLELKKEHPLVHILTPLSDGADRLIVYEAMQLGMSFSVVLPFSKAEYMKDFSSTSKEEFEYLIDLADEVILSPQSAMVIERDKQYEACGHYISDNCDVLVSLWDEKDSALVGGTSEIVAYHVSKPKSVLYQMKVARVDDVSEVMAQFTKITTPL